MSLPTWVTHDARTAACFFSAAFLGENAEKYLRDLESVVCIDIDAERLAQMKEMYPPSYTFVCADAYDSLEAMQGHVYDVVTVDPFTNQMRSCYDLLPKWRAISRRLVLGIAPEMADQAVADGAVQIVDRSSVAAWAVWT